MDLYASGSSVSCTSGTNEWTITGTINLDGVQVGDRVYVGSRTASLPSAVLPFFRILTIDKVAKTFTTTDNATTTYSGVPFFIVYGGASGVGFLAAQINNLYNLMLEMYGISSSIFAGGGSRFLLRRQAGASAIAELMFALRSGDVNTGAFFLRQRQVSGVEVLDFISTTDGTTEVVVFRITRAGVVSFPSSLSTVAFQAESMNTGPLGGLRNLLLNGSMDIWQRGTSGLINTYGPDRWGIYNVTAGSRSTDVPDSRFLYSVEFGNSSASFPNITQLIEAANCRHLVGKKARLSFWAKNVSGSASLYVDLAYANAVDNFSGITVITSATASASPSSSWTRYSLDLGTMPSGAANGLYLAIVRSDAAATTTRVTGVQLEIGEVASNYEFVGERGGIAAELARCQRYARPVGAGAFGKWLSASVLEVATAYPEMRATPSASLLSTSARVLDVNTSTFTATGLSLEVTITPTVRGGYFKLTLTGGGSGTLNNDGVLLDDVILLTAEL